MMKEEVKRAMHGKRTGRRTAVKTKGLRRRTERFEAPSTGAVGMGSPPSTRESPDGSEVEALQSAPVQEGQLQRRREEGAGLSVRGREV